MSDITNSYRPGRHLVHVPGPTNVPDAVLRAISRPTIDHRGPEFAELTLGLLTDIRRVFKTTSPVVMFGGSGTGAWEAALVNTLSPGDHVLASDVGQFSSLWIQMARQFDLVVDVLDTDWRRGIDVAAVEARLAADHGQAIKAVFVTHNETATGVLSDVAAVRGALDRVGHDALLLVDAVSSLGSLDYRHDDWHVDVTIAASQKGFMLPPGLGFNAVSDRALEAVKTARLPRSYWSWEPVLEQNERGLFPYTPPTNLLFGLRTALDMLFAEGLDAVFERHARLAAATRAAVAGWGLELQCQDPAAYSPTVSTVVMPEGFREEEFRKVVYDRFALSLGAGLGKLTGQAFRIGHLGDINELGLISALTGVELGLRIAGVPHKDGGVAAAVDALATSA